MKRIALLAALALSPYVATAQPLAFTDITVINVAEGVAEPGRTVIVEGDRITTVGATRDVQVPPGTVSVAGEGKYLIPGLWDMHAHTSVIPITREVLFPLFIAHGVTGIRNMAADCFPDGEPDCVEDGFDAPLPTIYDVEAWREEMRAGTLVGPRIVAGSYYVNGPRSAGSTSQAPGTAAHGRAHARLLSERGVDFVKVYDEIPREAYLALAEEANRLGLPFAGHVPVAVRASEASAVGQRSIEHVGGGNVGEECSADEEGLRGRVVAALQAEESLLPMMLEMPETYAAAKCAALFEALVENGTWVVPTLMIARLPSEVGDGWREDPRVRYTPRGEREYWAEWQNIYEAMLGTPEEQAPYARWVREVVDAMNQAGVPLLAGSDAGYPGIFWGSGLHEELVLLAAAGMSNAEALRAATLSPAEFLGATDTLGTVEAGKLADLVLLEANPLEDISNTQRIAAVVTRGRFFDREALDALLSDVERAAQKD